jgi:hypothetical protein
MAAIWKFMISATINPSVTMPKGAHVLSIQEQNGQICIWASVNPRAEPEPRRFFVAGTGFDIPEAAGAFLATVQVGAYVWHVFEDPRA